MQKERLQVLKKHGEIFTDFDELPVGVTIWGLRSDNENERYLVSYKFFEIFNKIITTHFLDPDLQHPDIIGTAIKNKLRFYSPIKEDQIKLISQKIIEKNEELELLTGKLGYPFIPATIEKLIGSWSILFTSKEILKIIELLKFNILRGKRIETFEPEDEWLIKSQLFQSQKMPLFREAAYLYSVIDYLKGLINDLQNPQKSQNSKDRNSKKIDSNKNFTYKDIAIAFRFLGGIPNGDEANILKKYCEKQSVDELNKAYRENMNELEMTRIRLNKTADTKHLKSLQRAKGLIISKKNKKAENDIGRVIQAFQANFEKQY